MKDINDFQRKLEDLGALPSAPTILMELLSKLRDESTTTDEIAFLVGQDAGLTARLLKLANSAALGLRVQVTSINRAVALLGRTSVRQICMGDGVWASLKPLAAKAQFNLDSFEMHSLVGAEVAQELARKSKIVEADDVYAASLLHDIGKFLLLVIDKNAYAETLLMARKESSSLLELEKENLGWTHTMVGGWLAELWKLPETVSAAASLHHEAHTLTADTPHRQLVCLVAIANNLMKVLKVGDSGNPVIEPIGTLLPYVNLTPNHLQEIAQKLKG